MPRMNDRPAASIAFWFASEIMPASATTVTSGSRWAAMNFSMTGSMVLVSALFPSNAETIEREAVLAGEQADRDLRLQPAFLGEPGLPEPVARAGLEVERGHVVEDERRRAHQGRRVLAGCCPAGRVSSSRSVRDHFNGRLEQQAIVRKPELTLSETCVHLPGLVSSSMIFLPILLAGSLAGGTSAKASKAGGCRI